MNAYSTKLAEMFSATIIKIFFETSPVPQITNDEYEGEIRDKATKLNIPTVSGATLKNYDGSDMTADDLTESIGTLITDQQKAYYFKVKSLDKLKSFIKNPEGNMLDQLRGLLEESIAAYVLGFYGDVAAGNRHGTDVTSGTVTVTVTTGAVVAAAATPFTAAMVGRGFKALGHSQWYRVKTYTDSTHIVIEDDSDDLTPAYTGGAIAGGATYVVEAATAIQVTKSNVYSFLIELGTKLDERKIPKANRWVCIPSRVAAMLKQAPEYIPAIAKAYEDTVQNGLIYKVGGMMVYESEQVSGNGVDGWHILAGHKSAICFGMAMTETEIEMWLKGNFGKAYKGLNVYGAKVPDERRKALAEGFWKL